MNENEIYFFFFNSSNLLVRSSKSTSSPPELCPPTLELECKLPVGISGKLILPPPGAPPGADGTPKLPGAKTHKLQ